MKNKTLIYYFNFACLLLLFGIIYSCEMPIEKSQEVKETSSYDDNSYKIIEIDSCEYVISYVYCGHSICHKGNCKFCIQRNFKH